MTQSASSSNNPQIDDSPLVCFCHTVRRNELIAAIRAGADTIDKIKAETCASTGCGGCEPDVVELLAMIKEELQKSGS